MPPESKFTISTVPLSAGELPMTPLPIRARDNALIGSPMRHVTLSLNEDNCLRVRSLSRWGNLLA